MRIGNAADTAGKIFSGTASFGRSQTSLGSRRAAFAAASEEKAMKRTLIRYKTKPELADRNAELIAAVFAELKTAKVEGVRYLSLRLDDGTFVHFVETDADDRLSPH